MADQEISPGALKMAWKMVITIFPQARIPQPDRDLLLTLVTMVSLHDLLDASLVWMAPPPARSVLAFDGLSVVVKPARQNDFVLKKTFSESQIDRASLLAEEMFDRFHLDEEERETLFTALPCLGLHGLARYLRWIRKPPFPELG